MAEVKATICSKLASAVANTVHTDENAPYSVLEVPLASPALAAHLLGESSTDTLHFEGASALLEWFRL